MPRKLSATNTRPAVANALAPNRSDMAPDSGPETRKATVNGSR